MRSRKGFKEPNNVGWKSHPKYCGHIEPRDGVQLGRLFFFSSLQHGGFHSNRSKNALRTTQEPIGNQEIEANLDWVDESRETTLIRMEAYRHQAMAYNNKRSKLRQLQIGVLVLRKMFENMADLGPIKLQANWEIPHSVIKVGHGKAYHLEKLTGGHLPHP